MLRSIHPFLVRQACQARCYSQLAAVPTAAAPQPGPSSSSVNTTTTSPNSNTRYFVPRNTRGSMPVYTDIRNGGTKHLVLIRNVQGDISTLANDLAKSLFQPGSPEANRMKIQTINSRHLILSGGRWKNEVVRWLLSKGF